MNLRKVFYGDLRIEGSEEQSNQQAGEAVPATPAEPVQE